MPAPTIITINNPCTNIAPRFRPVEPGIVMQRRLQADAQQKYFLYIPQRLESNAKIFVTIHGISRNAREHARKFARFAEASGVVLIAPYFPTDQFPDYQRLGCKGKRADRALNEIVLEAVRLTGANAQKIYLFGYSGGAQFAHRYMFAYPDRVARVVLGAPGWYTFPDRALKFPRGIRNTHRLLQLHFNPAEFLRIPVSVLVGGKDDQRDDELNKSPKIDRLQGKTRIERGQRWIDAMINTSRENGLLTTYSFQLLPDSPHSFSIGMRYGGMGEKTFDFLFSEGNHAQAALPEWNARIS